MLLMPSKFVLVGGIVTVPAVVWIEFAAVGILAPASPGCSGRCDRFPLLLAETGLAVTVRSAGDVSFLSSGTTVGAPVGAAKAGSPDRAWRPREEIAPADARKRPINPT
jgi:hypothetical protein